MTERLKMTAGISLAIMVAAGLMLQYPLQTTWPIGGDATRYIADVKQVTKSAQQSWTTGLYTLAFNSSYPAATALFGLSKLLPLSWPERFTWWIVAGHTLVVISLARLLWRLAGWPAAAAAIAIWPFAFTKITSHVESGTLAQLLSLSPAIVMISLFDSRKYWLWLLLTLTFFLHPLTGIILAAVATLTFAAVSGKHQKTLPWPARIPIIITGVITLTLVAVIVWRVKGALFYSDAYSTSQLPLADFIKMPFGFFLLISPAGLVVLAKKYLLNRSPLIIGLFSFSFLAWLLANNHLLGIGVLTGRFSTYFAIATTALAAAAFPWLTTVLFPKRSVRVAVVIALFVSLSLAAWNENARIYNFYESPPKYARIHPDELAAIEWLEKNYAVPQVVASSRANRHSEWIPILSKHSWQGLPATDPLWHLTTAQLPTFLLATPYTHVILFGHREKPTEQFPAGMEIFPAVYKNDSVIILQVKNT